ncbi:CDP-glycerol glycerophosphotransferase family protein [Salinimicrobium sp. CAU 1759]
MTQETDAQKSTLGIVITDGVGFRNFILSDFLVEAEIQFDRVVIYSGLPVEIYEGIIKSKVEIREVLVYNESFRSWFWRKFKEVAHLQLHADYFGIKDNLKANRSQSNSNRGKVTRFIYRITHYFHSESFIQYLENKQQKTLKNHAVTRACLDYLKVDKPDILFFTHQRPPYVLPIFVTAKKLNINTISFIFSWDNLSSKGRMAANFDSFLVWSKLMKKELLYFYPSRQEEDVRIVGTPQFEPYVTPKLETTGEQFYNNFDLDPSKKTICYSCGDISTSQNDELYIKTIATFIEEGKLDEEVNFIVRTSPAEEPHRFVGLKEKFPFIRWNFPLWKNVREDHPEAWSQRVPTAKDLKDLRAILEHSDLGINMCSTMSLDFMIFDKPVINPVFGNEENGLYNDQRFLKFGHYEKVVESGAVKISTNEEELLEAINYYLQNPEQDSRNRKELLDLQIGEPLKDTSRRIALALAEVKRFE